MSREEKSENNNLYWKIIEGAFRTAVPETHPEAIRREWKAGGNEGVSFEREVNALYGFITSVDVYKGESGGRKFTNLQLTLDENEDGKTPVISIGIGTKYAQDFMKKLPNVDFSQDVRIRPFSFQPEGEDHNVIGVEIMQRDSADNFTKKIDSFFTKKEVIEGRERWSPTNGFPARGKAYDEQSDEEREIYKVQCRSFLIDYTMQNIAPKVPGNVTRSTAQESTPINDTGEPEYAEESINPDDIPF